MVVVVLVFALQHEIRAFIMRFEKVLVSLRCNRGPTGAGHPPLSVLVSLRCNDTRALRGQGRALVLVSLRCN